MAGNKLVGHQIVSRQVAHNLPVNPATVQLVKQSVSGAVHV